ncbi:MAG: hypothetical protein DMG38_00770 [Acidobacteria bacterium]|nr:MAG: hypothetical protein DMG38_00770 [Acidobacteriota bacterium]
MRTMSMTVDPQNYCNCLGTIQSATTGFTASVFSSHNRVSLKEAFEGPEPDDRKLSRPVLSGLAPSNGGWLLGGYDRIVGAMANLGHRLSDQTVGNILRRHDIPPARPPSTLQSLG